MTTQEPVSIRVEVTAGGLSPYRFLGRGYRDNEPVPDRRTHWPVAGRVLLPRATVRDAERLVLRHRPGAGKHYRTYMPFLKLAHEAGALREMEDRMM